MGQEERRILKLENGSLTSFRKIRNRPQREGKMVGTCLAAMTQLQHMQNGEGGTACIAFLSARWVSL